MYWLRKPPHLNETAEGPCASPTLLCSSAGRIPGGSYNGFSKPEKFSDQLIVKERSHQTHMIEFSCEIPCCTPSMRQSTQRRSGRSTSVRPGEGWCHNVLKFTGRQIAVEHPGIFKMQEAQPGVWRGGKSQLNSYLDVLERLGHPTDRSQSKCPMPSLSDELHNEAQHTLTKR